MKYLLIGGAVIAVAYFVFGVRVTSTAGAVGGLNAPTMPTTLGRVNLSGSPFSNATPPVSTLV